MNRSISVIIPTFNRAGLVQAAVDSVLAQRGDFRFEIVVVDDGSTADTAQALRRFEGRIRYVRQDNAGLNPARNHGLRLASSPCIALLDDDDVWLPFKTAVLMAALDRFPGAGFVHSDFQIWKPEGNVRRPSGLQSWFPEPLRWDDIYDRREAVPLPHHLDLGLEDATIPVYVGDLYRASLSAPMVLPSTAIVRREALGEAMFPEVDSVGDWEFFARLSHHRGAVFVPMDTTLNRSHDDPVRLTRTDPIARLQRRLGLIQRVWRQDAAFMAERSAEVDRIEADCWRALARLGLAAGHRQTAKDALRALGALRVPARASDALLWGLSHLPFAADAIRIGRTLRSRLRPPVA